LEKLGKKPSNFLRNSDKNDLSKLFSDFKHRFTNEIEIVSFLKNIGAVLVKYGSLYNCFLKNYDNRQGILPALLFFINELRLGDCKCYNSLIPFPTGKCAYKRLNLYLRWMVRHDNIDIGIWKEISPSNLIIPLDVHMHRIAKDLQLTTRNQADLKTAIEITEEFKKFDPDDPVKYDFALTRLPILKRNMF